MKYAIRARDINKTAPFDWVWLTTLGAYPKWTDNAKHGSYFYLFDAGQMIERLHCEISSLNEQGIYDLVIDLVNPPVYLPRKTK